jgi:SulP family sulfate permease
VTYSVTGELFFASNQEFIDAFEYHDDPPSVVVDLSAAHVWDATAVASLDAVSERYRTHYGTHVEVIGLNQQSAAIHRRLSGVFRGAH